MLRGMSYRQFLEWRTFEKLEPFGEDRADLRSAQIAQALWNIARDIKIHPTGIPLRNFILKVGDKVISPDDVKQDLKTQEMLIDAWVSTSNAMFEKRGVNGDRT